MTGEGKVVPAMSRRRIGRAEECLHSFLTSELDGELVVNFTPRPALPHTQEHGYPLNWWLGGSQGRSGRFGGEQISFGSATNLTPLPIYLIIIKNPVALQPYRALADRAAAAGQRS